MIELKRLWQSVVSGKTSIDSLGNMKDTLFHPTYELIKSKKVTDDDVTEYFIRLCLDYYSYSSEGLVLINDMEYDEVMNLWTAAGHQRIVFADEIANCSTWPKIKHKAPGMVGTVSKVYSREDLDKYLYKNRGVKAYILAPKFDGCSACIENVWHTIDTAVTRSDGDYGQDITQVVRMAKNAYIFNDNPDGFYKVELCVTRDSLKELIKEKKYKNRRSATTGIINSPKNLIYAKYLTIIPLARYNHGKLDYIPPDSKILTDTDPQSIFEEIEKLLKKIRSSDYQVRVDGVVLFPLDKDIPINENDIMESAKAYKVNTAFAFSPILFAYFSVGRLGSATPMLRVMPVDVNETEVEDVSLQSYDKFAGMDLHEGETVEIYSGGDVIPLAKIPEHREYPEGADYIKLKKECTYCHEKLTRVGSEYKCTNDNCFRVNTGKITNFVVKLGADDVSDKTIEDLYTGELIRHIPDLFSLRVDDISTLSGYDIKSAAKIVAEMKKIRTRGIPTSELFGALGIPDIATKKCQLIFSALSLKKAMNSSKSKIMDKLVHTRGIGEKTATTFCTFLKENQNMIETITDIVEVVNDVLYEKNVVFTGFRDKDLAKEFKDIGIDVSDNVTGKTMAVISASYEKKSPKCDKARAQDIPIVYLADVSVMMKAIKDGSW